MTTPHARAMARTAKATEAMHISGVMYDEYLALAEKYERAVDAIRAVLNEDPGACLMAAQVEREAGE